MGEVCLHTSSVTECYQDQDGTGSIQLLRYRSIRLGGSDLWLVSRNNWYMGLCSPVFCSKIICLSVLGEVTYVLCHGITVIWGYVHRCFVPR